MTNTSTSEIVLQSKEDAEQVLSAMKTLLDQYEQVTFADLLELTGLSSTFSDNKVGWTDLTGVEAKSINSGFILTLPTAKEL